MKSPGYGGFMPIFFGLSSDISDNPPKGKSAGKSHLTLCPQLDFLLMIAYDEHHLKSPQGLLAHSQEGAWHMQLTREGVPRDAIHEGA
jgi:hypothetical protein